MIKNLAQRRLQRDAYSCSSQKNITRAVKSPKQICIFHFQSFLHLTVFPRHKSMAFFCVFFFFFFPYIINSLSHPSSAFVVTRTNNPSFEVLSLPCFHSLFFFFFFKKKKKTRSTWRWLLARIRNVKTRRVCKCCCNQGYKKLLEYEKKKNPQKHPDTFPKKKNK